MRSGAHDAANRDSMAEIPRIRRLSLVVFLLGGIAALVGGWNFPAGHGIALAVLIPVVLVLTTDNLGLAIGTVILWVMTAFGCGWSRTEPAVPPFAFAALAVEGTLLLLVAYLWRSRHLTHLELQRVRQTDPLTGLLNAEGFRLQIRPLAAGLRSAGGQQLAVGMLDLDRFKPFNDQRGHLAGDEYLREFGSALRRNLPARALAARWGGDEFAVAIPVRDVGDAVQCFESLREALRSAGERHEPAVTASVGVEVVDPARIFETLGLEKVVAAADTALYAAKSDRGNRLHVRGRSAEM